MKVLQPYSVSIVATVLEVFQELCSRGLNPYGWDLVHMRAMPQSPMPTVHTFAAYNPLRLLDAAQVSPRVVLEGIQHTWLVCVFKCLAYVFLAHWPMLIPLPIGVSALVASEVSATMSRVFLPCLKCLDYSSEGDVLPKFPHFPWSLGIGKLTIRISSLIGPSDCHSCTCNFSTNLIRKCPDFVFSLMNVAVDQEEVFQADAIHHFFSPLSQRHYRWRLLYWSVCKFSCGTMPCGENHPMDYASETSSSVALTASFWWYMRLVFGSSSQHIGRNYGYTLEAAAVGLFVPWFLLSLANCWVFLHA
ncbi:hypothetical protein U1Q18_025209 [Sarracenia purpurea var. burkii]